ncbi:MAG TPA: NF038122 family metalloprotease [Caulobacteraceae bacterium]
MKINVTFDASTKGAPTGFFAAVNAAVQFWASQITNPITVSITFGYGSVNGTPMDTGALGESEAAGGHFLYGQAIGMLQWLATSPNDLLTLPTLLEAMPKELSVPGFVQTPTSSPEGVFLTLAQARALDLYFPAGGVTDGYVGLSSSASFTFDPNNRAVAGEYDAIGVLEHEIAEVLGRISNVGQPQPDADGNTDVTLLDLYRYSGPGALNPTSDTGNFSLDGVTMLEPFNNPSNGGDSGDWSNAVTNDSFNAFGAAGVELGVSNDDLTVMGALGYKLAGAPVVNYAGIGEALFLNQSAPLRTSIGQSFTSDLTVASGATLTIQGHIIALDDAAPTSGAALSFTNNGTVTISNSDDVYGVWLNQQIINAQAATISNAQGATFSVTSTGGRAIGIGSDPGGGLVPMPLPTTTNAGQFTVTASGDAYGVLTWDQAYQFTNSSTGVLTVTSQTGDAVGVDQIGGASTEILDAKTDIVNDGLIKVTGATSATGIMVVEPAFGQVVNNGTINAIASDPHALTVGIAVAGEYYGPDSGKINFTTPATITNTGTITARFAIYSYSDLVITAQSPSLIIHNSGTINGDVVLGERYQEIDNTGAINGNIYFDDATIYSVDNGTAYNSAFQFLGTSHDTFNGVGGKLNGSIYLGYGTNSVQLGGGAVTVYGGGGSDTIVGGTGADFFEIFRGENKITGGSGFNTLSFADSNPGMTVDLGKGAATGAGTQTQFTNIQEVIGSNFGNTFIAGASAVTFIAGGGHDVMTGGAAADTLVGGAGGDVMTGGGGADTFIYSVGDHQVEITDFGAKGDKDVLHVDGYASASKIAQQGANTLITLSNGDSILLDNVLSTSLVTGTNLIFSATAYQPSAPASPPVFGTKTIVFASPLTIASGEVVNETQHVGLIIDGYDDEMGYSGQSLADFGTIKVSDSAGNVIGLQGDIQGGTLGDSFSIGSGASFIVSAPAGMAMGSYIGPTAVDNSGIFSVSAKANAYGVNDGSPLDGVTNFAGATLKVVSTSGDAYGLMFGGGGVLNNAGTITVTGAGSVYGIDEDISQAQGQQTVTNSGAVAIQGDAAGAETYGIVQSGLYAEASGPTISNSGTISADIAIQLRDDALTPVQFPYLDLQNSGTIHGAIELGTGNDQIHNTGHIVGDITFGDGNVIYDGATGSLVGVIRLGMGATTVTLGASDGVVYGGGFADTITGGAGNDFIEIARGNNTVNGGAGRNILSFGDSNVGVTVNLGTGVATGSGTTNFKNIQEVIGSSFNDTLIAGSTAATLVAGAGKDVLTGGAGADTLIAGSGGDIMTGGGGNNTFIYSGGDHQLVINDFDQNGDTDTLDIYGYAAAQSISQQGADTLITLSSGDSILLKNVNMASVSGDKIVYSASAYIPPALPTSAPIFGLTSITIREDFVLFKGETFKPVTLLQDHNSSTGDYYGMLDSAQGFNALLGTTPHDIESFGAMNIARSAGDVDGVLFDGSMAAGAGTFTIEAGGVLQVTASGGKARGFYTGDFSPAVTNNGRMTISGHGDSYGLFASQGDPLTSTVPVLTNGASGTLTVTSSTGAAYGVWLNNGSYVTNDGSIAVTGSTSAYGLWCDNFSGGATGEITNTGTITVSASGAGAKAYGLWLGGLAQNGPFPGTYAITTFQNIRNSGTIKAPVAIMDDEAGFTPQQFLSLNIANTGTIDGVINLGGSYSEITSTGSIDGNILLFYGSDDIDLRGGAFQGAIVIDPTDVSGLTQSSVTKPAAVTDTIYTPAAGAVIDLVGGDSKLRVNVTDTATGAATFHFDVASTAAVVSRGPGESWTITAGVDGTVTVTNGAVLEFSDKTLVLPAPEAERYNFNGDGKSDLLVQNTSGAVVVGEVKSGALAYSMVTGLGSEWKFEGNGDFLGDGKEGFLIENTAGAVVVGEVAGGKTSFTQLTGLGSEWSFKGVGDFLGEGHDQFLIENSVGAIVVGDRVSGQTHLSQVSGLGSEWKFVGAGDFLGDGKDQFLIENTSGAVVVGEVKNGSAVYTQVSGLGPEWKFVGTGDFFGDGKDEFLVQNSSGAVVAGEVVNGQAHLTLLTGLGSEWEFVGAGDYLGEGHDQFLIENTAGAIVIGDWLNGATHLTQVGGLGSEWMFH